MSKQSVKIPKIGLDGLKENWRSDLQAGFMVFLIALPLCLGISMASGFPPAAGIITAIVGGLMVSRLNGSFVSINGPAAGLIVVIVTAVQTLGEGDMMAGYRYTLAAIMIAGLLQVIMGIYKAGQYSAFFPAAVVRGMLAAIGIIIIVTQSHVLLGTPAELTSIFVTIERIPASILNLVPEITFISVCGFAVLLFWPKIKHPKAKLIPAPIMVVLVGIILGLIFGLEEEQTLGTQFLVAVPDDFTSSFHFPDFSKTLSIPFWGAVIGICLVSSLESLISTKAVDKLDPYKRISDLDDDLTAVGLGNTLAGFLGGLPMIVDIIRSSANVDNGAKTGWSNFFHGLILLVFVVLFPWLIQSIPLASLAVLLVYTGFRLASPHTFKQVQNVGPVQLFLFVVTIIAVLATDLLTGVAIGILVKLGVHIVRGVWLKNIFKIYFTIEPAAKQIGGRETVIVKLLGSALFSNFLPLKKALFELENGKTIVFDFSDGYLIDHTVMEFIYDFSNNYEALGGQSQQVGNPLKKFSDHQLSARLMTADDRKN